MPTAIAQSTAIGRRNQLYDRTVIFGWTLTGDKGHDTKETAEEEGYQSTTVKRSKCTSCLWDHNMISNNINL